MTRKDALQFLVLLLTFSQVSKRELLQGQSFSLVCQQMGREVRVIVHSPIISLLNQTPDT